MDIKDNCISPTAQLYYKTRINNSIINDYSIIGDFSRIVNSSLGVYCKIDRNNFVTGSIIGDYTYTGPFDMIFNCTIGKYSSISYGVTIGPPEHNYRRLTMHPFIHNPEYNLLDDGEGGPFIKNDKLDKPITIGNDVWIGTNATLLRGISIGDGAIIGANSLVNKNVPPYAIVVGNPAKIIKYRFSDKIITELLKLKWWDWDVDKIRKNKKIFASDFSDELLSIVSD